AIEVIALRFGLSDFERDLLLLCAGVELDSTCAAACARLHGDPRRAQPSFGLALSVLQGAHWSALTPAAPLRRWRLLEVTPGPLLTTSALRIDERVLHAVAGIQYLDERLRGVVQPVPPPSLLSPSHQTAAEAAAHSWIQQPAALVLLGGPDASAKAIVAAAAAARAGCTLYLVRSGDLPTAATDREVLARVWEREAALQNAALLLALEDGANAETLHAARAFAESVHGRLAVSARESIEGWRRDVRRLEVDRPSMSEQRGLWEESLGRLRHVLNGGIERVASHFSLSPATILAAGEELKLAAQQGDAATLDAALWASCRRLARPRLDDLAERIESNATWDDLVLPPAQTATLRNVAAQVRHRFKVYEQWGFRGKIARGLGITALFAGVSGTGKTLAAEVLAGELGLDLYRIDLSSVVSKYIGETEKNLRRVFDAAEAGGAVLLFDEADALFGKRTEVKDSHDRYANIEVSYLLQRMEAYRGLAILTTNLKNVLDTAFLRRIRFVVQFPFPDQTQRAEIWRRVLPDKTPCGALNLSRLAQLSVAGGNIRNIALNAAFLAAEARQSVGMDHLLAATRSEYAKLEKPLTDAEIGGWL
ncbi:MAG: ATP-binding protein, partial [Nitrospira sp.]|nr:ATP-binding protein [Nitrospira sp.]